MTLKKTTPGLPRGLRRILFFIFRRRAERGGNFFAFCRVVWGRFFFHSAAWSEADFFYIPPPRGVRRGFFCFLPRVSRRIFFSSRRRATRGENFFAFCRAV